MNFGCPGSVIKWMVLSYIILTYTISFINLCSQTNPCDRFQGFLILFLLDRNHGNIPQKSQIGKKLSISILNYEPYFLIKGLLLQSIPDLFPILKPEYIFQDGDRKTHCLLFTSSPVSFCIKLNSISYRRL